MGVERVVRVVSLEQTGIQTRYSAAVNDRATFVRVVSEAEMLDAVAVECDLLIISTHGHKDSHNRPRHDSRQRRRGRKVLQRHSLVDQRVLPGKIRLDPVVCTSHCRNLGLLPDLTTITAARRLIGQPASWATGETMRAKILDTTAHCPMFRDAGWWIVPDSAS